MAADIYNVTGTSDGNQKIGSMTVNVNRVAVSVNPVTATLASGVHNGSLHGGQLISINSISGQYDTRFDDVGYYE